MTLNEKMDLAIEDAWMLDAPRNKSCIKRLLRAGADPNASDAQGWTPLARAARVGKVHTMEMLVDAGADPRMPGPAGFSVCAIALGARVGSRSPGDARVGAEHMECALWLVPKLDVGWGLTLDAGGWTPLARLYRSLARFELSWMTRLEEAGSPARANMLGGWTLLRLAAEVGSESCALNLARWAMTHRVDPGEACAGGILPEEAATKSGKLKLAGELRSARERQALGSVRASGLAARDGSEKRQGSLRL